MRINQNIAALNTYRQLSANNVATGKSLEKLSSGLRINRAGDDAAGLAISEKMRAQVRGLDQASRNSQDAISLIQTAEGALNETHSILQRMRELAVQAANDTNVDVDRGQIQKEINQLTSEINRISNTTEFNTMKLLDGSRLNNKVVTTSSTTGLNDAGATLTAALADVSYAGDGTASKAVFEGNAITLSSGNGAFISSGAGTSGTSGTIDIWVSGGKLIVDVKGQISGTSPGVPYNISGRSVISANASGKFVYDDFGVSFTISSVAGWTSGATNKISYSIENDQEIDASLSTSQTVWTANNGTSGSARAATAVSGGTINLASGLEAGVYTIRLVSFAGQASGAIEITRSGTNGKTLVDRLSGVAASGVYSFNGITFGYQLSGLGSGGSGTLSFEVKKSATNSATTGADNSLTFQIGSNENQSMSLSIGDMSSKALGISSAAGSGNFVSVSSGANVTNGTNSTSVEYSLDVSSATKAAKAITLINDAINTVSTERAKLGSVQNRLEHTINNLGTSSENLAASESRIRDVDMARQMMEFTKNNILTQAAQSMLAQANQQPQGVLQLLR